MRNTPPLSPLLFFKALSDETRLAIMLLLHKKGELCVCDITALIHNPQPKMSRHLALLRKAGLLRSQRRQQWVYYTVHPNLPQWSLNILQETLELGHYQIQSKSEPGKLPDHVVTASCNYPEPL